MFNEDGALTLDLIALGALIASIVGVARASNDPQLARGRGLLLAGGAPLVVGLWVLWRIADARWLWGSLLVGVLCALTTVLALEDAEATV